MPVSALKAVRGLSKRDWRIEVALENNSATKPNRDPVRRVWCDEEQTWLQDLKRLSFLAPKPTKSHTLGSSP